MEYEIPNFPAVLFWAAPIFTLLIAIEWYLVSRKRISGTYVVKDAITSSSMGVGQLISDVLMGGISIGILMWVWQFRFFDWGFSIKAILICLVLQ
ncbi:MAG: sterol desaturase family protein, partial [Hellea sp.]